MVAHGPIVTAVLAVKYVKLATKVVKALTATE
jgi:hypothetical protein